jgi:hypothetical protein
VGVSMHTAADCGCIDEENGFYSVQFVNKLGKVSIAQHFWLIQTDVQSENTIQKDTSVFKHIIKYSVS